MLLYIGLGKGEQLTYWLTGESPENKKLLLGRNLSGKYYSSQKSPMSGGSEHQLDLLFKADLCSIRRESSKCGRSNGSRWSRCCWCCCCRIKHQILIIELWHFLMLISGIKSHILGAEKKSLVVGKLKWRFFFWRLNLSVGGKTSVGSSPTGGSRTIQFDFTEKRRRRSIAVEQQLQVIKKFDKQQSSIWIIVRTTSTRNPGRVLPSVRNPYWTR